MEEKQWIKQPKMTYVLSKPVSQLTDEEKWYRRHLIIFNREKLLSSLSPVRTDAVKLLNQRLSQNSLKYYYKNREKILQKIKARKTNN